MSTTRSETAKTPRKRLKQAPSLVALLVPFKSGLRVSKRSFARVCRWNGDLRLERTARGELIVMAPAGMESGGRNLSLGARLWNWNDAGRLGRAFDSSAGFTLPNGAIRAADAAWISRERWNELSIEDRKGFANVVPDFVVELRSDSDRLPIVQAKMREYIDQGVRLAWLIDPLRYVVEIYRPNRPVEVLDKPKSLSGEEVLQGFVLDLEGILEPEIERERKDET